MSRSLQPGTAAIFACCIAIGAATVVATLALGGGLRRDSALTAPPAATEDYGRRLIAQTTEYLGPDAADPKMRYTRSRLHCAACHLGVGADPGVLSLAAAANRYPRKAARLGGIETLEMRINGCMTRSLNGRPLPENRVEMLAMVSYLRFVAARNAATGAAERATYDPANFRVLPRAANLAAGRHVFESRCTACHGSNGAGVRASTNPALGYIFPPLWGDDSFNNGAGMHRVLTAAAFIKAKMPLGRADLSDDQAFDVAAFINSQPRPEMSGLDRDYPDRAQKPVDNPYPPYADPFPVDQHRFGPFAPIQAFYKKAN